MAGVKGRSGGPRKNSGGARPGAGRKPKPKPEIAPPAPADTPLEFLKGVMNDTAQDPKLRVRAAIAAAQYEHLKKGDGGKRDDQAEKARRAASNFAPGAPRGWCIALYAGGRRRARIGRGESWRASR